MTSLRDRNRSRTRDDIEAAAIELFERHGYAATTVEQIARQAGVSQATFFRHFGSKEEVLFVNEQGAVDGLIELVTNRTDRRQNLDALAAPVAAFAHTYLHDANAETQRVTRLVMTTRELEPRSMRMRLRWEHALAKQLATERGTDDVTGPDVLLSNLAVGCLAAALWEWQRTVGDVDIEHTTATMFRRAIAN